MNREIKFRAWDIESKKFRWEQNLYINSQFFDTCLLAWPNENMFYKKRFVFQQYTGIKDENGKDIYEGDLLKYPGSLPSYLEVYWNNQAAKFNTKVHRKHSKLLAERPFSMENLVKLQVIGNIFENPELLK